MQTNKTNRFSLGEKVIETPSLRIRKNIMMWEDTMIQLSNVSYLSANNIAATVFPVWAAVMILAGLLLISQSALVALVLIGLGGLWIYLWYQGNEKRKQGAILTIRMNSGHTFQFTFNNKAFLLEVLKVLENIIVDGTDSQVSINISNSTISGNARVLENANL